MLRLGFIVARDPHWLWKLLLLCGDIHPNPGPPRVGGSANVTQYNINGSSNVKVSVLHSYVVENNIDILSLQETKYENDDVCAQKLNKQLVHCDVVSQQRFENGSSGGGVAALLNRSHLTHKAVAKSAKESAYEWTLEQIFPAEVSDPEPLFLLNMYCTPSSRDSFPSEAIEAALARIPPEHGDDASVLITMDANCHHPAWDTNHAEDPKGTRLHDWLSSHGYQICNDKTQPTRLGRRLALKDGAPHLKHYQKDTSPDLTIAKNCTVENWKIDDRIALGTSDHRPINFKVTWGAAASGPPQQERPKHAAFSWNKMKTDEFVAHTDRELGALLDRYYAATARGNTGHHRYRINDFTHDIGVVIAKATKKFVPRGTYGPEKVRDDLTLKREAATELNRQAELKAQELQRNPNCTESECTEAFKAALQTRQDLNDAVKAESRAHHIKSCNNMKAKNCQAWRRLKNSKSVPTHRASALTDKRGKPITTVRGKAEAFVDHYANVSKMNPRSRIPQAIKCRNSRLNLSKTEYRSAIDKILEGKASGLDEVYAEALKRLGSNGERALRTAISESICLGRVPQCWKRARVIPLHKSGKDASKTASYRPVALTSIIAKLAERIVYERIIGYVDPRLSDNQEGFRAGRSTVNQIAALMQTNLKALKEGSTALTVLVDFSKAFDMVDHNIVINKLLNEFHVPTYLVRWIREFLVGREICTRVENIHSSLHKITCGVPQGSVLAPLLFLVFIDELSVKLSGSNLGLSNCSFFADDLAMTTIGKSVDELVKPLRKALAILEKWAGENFFEVNADKTVFTLVTRSRSIRAEHINLTYKGVSLKHDPEPKFLGAYQTRPNNFVAHAKHMRHEFLFRLSQLRSFVGQDYGPSAPDIRTFYLARCFSALMYASEIWMCHLPKAEQERLKSLHAQAARLISGATQASNAEAALLEANLIPLDKMQEIREIKQLERCMRLDGKRLKTTKSPLMYTAAKATVNKLASDLGYSDRQPMPRLPIKTRKLYATDKTDFADHVTVNSVLDGRKKDSIPKEEAKKLSENAIRLCLGDCGLIGSSDGSVQGDPADQFKLRPAPSGSAAILYAVKRSSPSTPDSLRNDPIHPDRLTEIGSFSAASGPVASSCTAEGFGSIGALNMTLETLNRLTATEKLELSDSDGFIHCVYPIDSQAWLKIVEQGPVTASCYQSITLWNTVHEITKNHKVKLFFQHVFSHRGVAVNEAVDKLADEAAKLDQHFAPVHYGDFVAFAARRIEHGWRSSLSNKRTAFCGNSPTTSKEHLDSRADDRLLAQLRTGECPLLGKFRHRVNGSHSTNCRWCCPDTEEQKAFLAEALREKAKAGRLFDFARPKKRDRDDHAVDIAPQTGPSANPEPGEVSPDFTAFKAQAIARRLAQEEVDASRLSIVDNLRCAIRDSLDEITMNLGLTQRKLNVLKILKCSALPVTDKEFASILAEEQALRFGRASHLKRSRDEVVEELPANTSAVRNEVDVSAKVSNIVSTLDAVNAHLFHWKIYKALLSQSGNFIPLTMKTIFRIIDDVIANSRRSKEARTSQRTDSNVDREDQQSRPARRLEPRSWLNDKGQPVTACPTCGSDNKGKGFRTGAGLTLHQKSAKCQPATNPTVVRGRNKPHLSDEQKRSDKPLHIRCPNANCCMPNRVFTVTGIQHHLRKCKPSLCRQKPPKYNASNFAAPKGDLQEETIDHVLFECPALLSVRPPSLKCLGLTGFTTVEKRKLLTNQETADFVRAALLLLDPPSPAVAVPPAESNAPPSPVPDDPIQSPPPPTPAVARPKRYRDDDVDRERVDPSTVLDPPSSPSADAPRIEEPSVARDEVGVPGAGAEIKSDWREGTMFKDPSIPRAMGLTRNGHDEVRNSSRLATEAGGPEPQLLE
jgi:ribonuclease HI